MPETRTVLENASTLRLKGDTFDHDGLLFSELESTWIRLKHRTKPESVRVAFAGFPSVIVWAWPLSPYICIEPCFLVRRCARLRREPLESSLALKMPESIFASSLMFA